MNNTLLLADDDPLLHRVVGFKLAQHGWQIVSAYDGAGTTAQADHPGRHDAGNGRLRRAA
uniref:hypothetical protein n=1 Tax=Prosthecobacter sp. TaxID=1965333 RepID=UPI003784AD80